MDSSGKTPRPGPSGKAICPDDASWSGTPLTFPRIQGADVCGTDVSVGDVAQAQTDFLAKKHTGKLVLIPPQVMPVT